MTSRFGIDTSVLVRLLTGDPEDVYQRCLESLTDLVENGGAELFASSQVIGEAYVAVQHHYGVDKADARSGLISVLSSGLVAPLHGEATLTALAARTGCGLLDRLIAEDYRRAGLQTLTLDRKMAALPQTRPLLRGT
jgi:predicted nucleic acid-binding protein